MKVRSALAALTLVCLLGQARLPADEVIDWNNVVLQAIRGSSMNAPRASRALAMTHAAIYDAVNSIDDSHQPYHVNLSASSDSSRGAAAAQSAHDVLVNLFPTQQVTFDAALANSLSSIPDGPSKMNGRAIGEQVATQIVTLRANDHSSDTTSYTPGTLPGQWRPTPSGFAPANLPNWPTVTPWSMTSGSQFRHPAGAPALSSVEYAAALNEVKDIGAVNSASRTADQTDIARFWADGGGTSTGPGHWNRIAQTVAAAQGNTLSENARMFALLNLAEADATIVSWDNKYLGPTSSFWRPVTAIQLADQDGNAATDADPNWMPLLTTPAHPSYTSGHSTNSGAAAEIFKQFYGTDNISFTSSAEGAPGVSDRAFSSFSQAALEAADSRLYGGIHYRFDNEHGLENGIAVGRFIFANELQPIPVPEPGTWVLLGLGFVVCRAGRRLRRVS
ncbi:MAG TPA: PEP-CTERM sorting domain-containing protein [Lacipirellulaceae bacterium]|nr:PEP-CTERM sorting domain-containing protein [Lacipirellulaceae bacterium]